MSDVQSLEPALIIAGDTVKWKKSFSNYSAAEGWELEYVFGGAADITLAFGTEVTADGGDFLVNISATASQAFAVGNYWYRGRVSKAGEVVTVSEGSLTITNTTKQYAEYNDVKTALANIEAVLNGRASKDQESYSIKVPFAKQLMRWIS